MMNNDDIRVLNSNCKQYILEELAVLEGCVAQGLGFSHSKPSSSEQKQNVFIVYPGNEENAFIQAKRQLKKFDTPEHPFLFDVQWLRISVHEELDNNNHDCWSRFVTSTKILFETKQKNLLFLISIGKKYHEGNYLKATVNLFANAIRGCAELIKQEKDLKQLNKEKNIDNAKGEWRITVVAADTLQAYNDPLYDSQREEIIKKQYEHGQEWIKLATPIFAQLKNMSEDLIPVNIRFFNWSDYINLAIKDFSYYKYYNHLSETYTQPNSTVEANYFYDSVREKGFRYLDSLDRIKQDPVPTKLTDSKQLIGLSDPEHAKKNPQFILEQCRIVKNFIYNIDHRYRGPAIELNILNSGVSIPFQIPQLTQSKCISRDHLLKQLKQLLTKPPSLTPITLENIILCYGAGGVGKSHLLATYANSPDQHYTLRIWLNCRSENDLMISFKQLGQSLMIVEDKMKYDDIKQKVIQWLEDNPGWLIIMDDVFDYNEVITYLPKINAGHIIFSSRVRSEKFINTLEVCVMNENEAVSLFSVISERKENDNNIRELTKKLSYIPLAIELAAAYLKVNPAVTIQQYEREYEKDCLDSMGNKDLIKIAGGIANKPIAVTYNMSIGRIREKYHSKDKNNKISAIIEELLTVCAYLAPNNIPLLLLSKWFHANWVIKFNTEKEYFEKAIIILIDHLFIQHDSHNNLISIHSVMQDVIRAKHYKSLEISVESRKDGSVDKVQCWLDNISIAIDEDILEYYDGYTVANAIEARKDLHSHIAKLLNFYSHCSKLSVYAIKIQILAGYILSTLNNFDKTINILEPLLSLQLDNSTNTTLLYLCLALAYERKNNVIKSKDLLQTYCNTYSGHNDKDILFIKSKLAIYYALLKETNNAVALLNEILPKLKIHYDEESEEYCNAISSLSGTYFAMGKYIDAKQMGESILNICRSKRYITYLTLIYNLSLVYHALGQPLKAKSLIQEAINIQDIIGDRYEIEKNKSMLRLTLATLLNNEDQMEDNHLDDIVHFAESGYGDDAKLTEMTKVFTTHSKTHSMESENEMFKFISTMNQTPTQRQQSQSFIKFFGLINSLQSQSNLERKLRTAAASRAPEALKFYLPLVKNINNQGENSKKTALHWAVIKASKECVSILLSAGADLSIQDDSKQSAFDYALTKSTEGDEYAAILELLREHILETTLAEFIEKERLENIAFQQTLYKPIKRR